MRPYSAKSSSSNAIPASSWNSNCSAEGHRALAAGDHPRALGLLREALDQWRGPALADVQEAPYAPAQAARLAEARLAALEDRIEAELAGS